MRRSGAPSAIGLVLALALSATGCQQIFTTSLASALKRSSPPVPTISSYSDLLNYETQLKANPDVAAASMPQIIALVNSTSDPTTKAAIEATAVEVAIAASASASNALIQAGDILLASSLNQAAAGAALEQITFDPNVITALSYALPVGGVTLSGSDQVLAGAILALNQLKAASVDLATTPPATIKSDISGNVQTLIQTGVTNSNGSQIASLLAGFMGL